MKLYHATDFSNLSDILDEGLKPPPPGLYTSPKVMKRP